MCKLSKHQPWGITFLFGALLVLVENVHDAFSRQDPEQQLAFL